MVIIKNDFVSVCDHVSSRAWHKTLRPYVLLFVIYIVISDISFNISFATALSRGLFLFPHLGE